MRYLFLFIVLICVTSMFWSCETSPKNIDVEVIENTPVDVFSMSESERRNRINDIYRHCRELSNATISTDVCGGSVGLRHCFYKLSFLSSLTLLNRGIEMSKESYCRIKDCDETFWTDVDDHGEPDESFCPDHENAYRDISDERWGREKRSQFYPRLECNDTGSQFRKDMEEYLTSILF